MIDSDQVLQGRARAQLVPAGELLGAQHPLAMASRAVHAAVVRLAAAAAFAAGAILLAVVRGQSAKALVIAALVVAPLLVATVAGAVASCRLQARDVIIGGLEHLPARELRGTRRRLARPRHRHDLALALRQLAEDDALREPVADDEEPADVAVLLGTVADELDGLDDQRVRGVAACERLIDDGVLVELARDDRERLRSELRRLRFLLVAR